VGAKVLHALFGNASNVDAWLLIIGGLAVIAMIRQSPDGLSAFNSRLLGKRLPKFPRRATRSISLDLSDQVSPLPMTSGVSDTIEVRGLSARFGGVVALNDVSFVIRPGEVLGLMGPNGAGKTTLVDILTGFTKQTAGSVLRNGVPIDRWSPERRARSGIVRSWQAVELFDGMTVGENLLAADDTQRSGRYLTDLLWPGHQRPSPLFIDLVTEFGLAHLLDQRPDSLSQGTVRLIGIARAMCAAPSVLLLDEPAAGLDAEESRELGQAIRKIAEDRGIAVLVVEHDVPMLMKICDRIVVLDFGIKIADGEPQEISRSPEVIRAYLGDDPTSKHDDTIVTVSLSGADPR
jgi:sulfate-transporting ATPase